MNTEFSSGPVGSISASGSDDSSGDEHLQHDGSSKKRKRPLKISCELCKARKVKCDRAEPSCGWCARNHRVCIYNERRKPGLRASYGVEVEDKLNRIETGLYLLGRRLEAHITASGCQEDQAFTAHSATESRATPRLNHNHTLGDTQPQDSWTSMSAPYSMAMPSAQSVNVGSAQTLVGDMRTTQSSSELPPIVDPRSHGTTGDELPDPEVLFSIVDTYFKHVGTWSPILERKATFDMFSNDAKPLGDAERILLHGIVVVTMRFFEDPRLSTEQRQIFHTGSKQRVQLYAMETPSIAAMKALALVTVDALGTSNSPQGWNLLALLARNIVHLGLGVEKSVYLAPATTSLRVNRPSAFTLPQPESWIEDEGRRRLYWLTYILDRYATIATGLNFILEERETDRSLPCRYDLFSKNESVETRWIRAPDSTDFSKDCPENLGSFSYHCEVLQILSQIHDFLRLPVDINSTVDVDRWRDTYRALDGKLNSWLSHLPGEYGKISQLCHSDPGSRVSNWIMIHAAFVTSVIRLHSVAAYPAARSHLVMSSPNAVQRCLAAVESLRAIAQDVIDTKVLNLLGPPFAFSLWTSGRLLLVHAAVMDVTADSKIWFLITTLETMGQYWEVAKTWAHILSRLVREGQQADEETRQGKATSGKTFAEMRGCAHDLAMLMARQPRTVIDPPATRTTSQNELEYLDVFGWFSYPRTPPAPMLRRKTDASVSVNRSEIDTLQMSDTDTGWMTLRQPYEFKPPYE